MDDVSNCAICIIIYPHFQNSPSWMNKFWMLWRGVSAGNGGFRYIAREDKQTFFQEWSSESLLCSTLQHYNNFQCSYAEMHRVCMCQRNNTTCKHLISWLACLLAPSLGPYHWFSIAMQMTCSCAFPYHPKMSAPKWLTLLITSTCECQRSCVSCAEVRHKLICIATRSKWRALHQRKRASGWILMIGVLKIPSLQF